MNLLIIVQFEETKIGWMLIHPIWTHSLTRRNRQAASRKNSSA